MRAGESNALTYDEAAISALYGNKKLAAKNIPLFCTDSHADSEYVDCRRFDQGASPLAYAAWQTANLPKTLAQSVLDQFRLAKLPRLETPTPLERVKLASTESLATSALASRNNAFRALDGNLKVLKIRRQFLK